MKSSGVVRSSGVATCDSRSGISLGQRVAPGCPRVAEALGWTLRVVDLSGEKLGSLDTYHHPDASQILTTTYAPTFSLTRVCGREVWEAKILG